ncbi:hypothetical protein NE237_000166 [Protea cynaroides]|uniref:Uncharacterized protein n=1 Tax=Protea cynaroides TaxID=273540 RepID=A0A9Q0GM79_9MAGN|nr:hypothetical protein NE237_000166 [Protea cynaroides]
METRLLSSNTTYIAYLVFKLADIAEGFGYDPVEMSIKLTSDGRPEHEQVKYVYLTTPKETAYDPPYEDSWSSGPEEVVLEESEAYSWRAPDEREAREVPKKRGDGWMEIQMGEFFNERGDDGEVEMSLKEVKFPWWQFGLIVEGIELRPKENQ